MRCASCAHARNLCGRGRWRECRRRAKSPAKPRRIYLTAPDSLLRQVDEWHGELRKVSAGNQMFWRPSGIQPLDIDTGSREDPVTWRSRELMSAQDLVEEGRLLRHCVSTYAASCARGAYSIWSVEQQEKGERASRQLTVAIDDKAQMVEARGYANRKPTESEQRILQIWMTRANLRPGRYLYGY